MILRPEPMEYKIETEFVDRTVNGIKQKKVLKDGTERERVQGRIMLPTNWIGRTILVLLLDDVPNEIGGVADNDLKYYGTRTGVAKPYNATRAKYGMLYLPGEWAGKKVRCYLLMNFEQFSA